jgi:ribonuclease T1
VLFFGRLPQWCPLRRQVIGAGIAAVLALGSPLPGVAKQQAERSVIAQEQLPAEARDVLDRIHTGGPFAYERDGTEFGNRERHLPPYPRGYYREYTVMTPGVPDRGPRRIVCGGHTPRMPDACYYTPDHYNRFLRISP